jgi:hypothetical protein
MLTNPDELLQLIRQKIDHMVTDPDVQEFLQVSNHFHPNHGLDFSVAQETELQCYYKANQLLLDCSSNNNEATVSIRQEVSAGVLAFQEPNSYPSEFGLRKLEKNRTGRLELEKYNDRTRVSA